VSRQAIESEAQPDLRLRALARLTGHADAASPRASPATALGVLFELASSPSTSGDALALLHELQVHQVEVELQAEELRGSRGELEARLIRQTQLYDLAPAACFTIDRNTAICESNLAGARLFGTERDALPGRRLEQLFTPDSGGSLRAMLADVRDRAAPRTACFRLAGEGARRALHASVCADATDGRFQIVLIGDSEDAGARG